MVLESATHKKSTPEGARGTPGNQELMIIGAPHAGQPLGMQYGFTGPPVWVPIMGLPPKAPSSIQLVQFSPQIQRDCPRMAVTNGGLVYDRSSSTRKWTASAGVLHVKCGELGCPCCPVLRAVRCDKGSV